MQPWSEVTPAMLHSVDSSGQINWVSDLWLAKLGYERDEVIGRLWSQFLTPQSQAYALTIVLPEFIRTGRCENIEYQFIAKDGRIIDVLLSAVLDGSVDRDLRSVAVITDVTDNKEAERRLAESEAQYRELVEDQSELISLATPDGELRFVNHAYAQFHQCEPKEMIGRNVFDIVTPDARPQVIKQFRAAWAAVGCSIESENQVVLPDGSTRWIAWTNRAVVDAAGIAVAIHSVGRDVELRVAAEQLLRKSESRYRMLEEYGTDMVFQLDMDFRRRYVSPACREIIGYSPEEMTGVNPVSMVHPDDADRVAEAFKSVVSGGAERQSVTNRIRHKDGRWIWVEAQLRTWRDPQTRATAGIIGSLRDISARKAIEDQLEEANRRLEALSVQDGLTGLANRRAFDDALSREAASVRRSGGKLALVMIDVDNFKAFNDNYGHPAGDECLRMIGGALREAAFRPDDLAARYGGEEFAMLLPHTDELGASAVANRIRKAIHSLGMEHCVGSSKRVTVSAGVADLAPDNSEPDNLLHRADHALYVAKRRGRDAVVRWSTAPRTRSPKRSAAA